MRTSSVLLLVLAASAHAQSPGAFTAAGNMITPRFVHTATLLHNGKVLIAGGNAVCYFGSPCLPAASAELYDPATGNFTPTGSMTMAYPGGAVLLPDGKVLIAGGDITYTMTSVELYDPSTGTFNTAGKPATLKGVYSTTLLNDGRVLLSGSVRTSPPFVPAAELYDPAAGTFSPVANWPGQDFWFPLVVLTGGAVLLVSGDSESSEIYDPSTDTFRLTGSLPYSNAVPRAALLLSGKVLFTGGSDLFGSLSRVELYDPDTGNFTATGSLSTARNSHSATLLPDGTVLVAGGGGQFGGPQPSLASAEIYDPATGTFAATGSLHSARYAHTATLLNSGQVLLTGGIATPRGSGSDSISAIASAELYTPTVVVPAPALFSLSGNGQGQGAIWHAQTGQIASAENPASAGEALSMYTTSLREGGVIPPQVSVGGRLAQVLYFGAAPGYPGYNQINFLMPGHVPPGPAVPVRLMYIGRSSNAVTVGVQ